MRIFAQELCFPGDNNCVSGPADFRFANGSVGSVISSLIQYITVFAGIALLLMLIYGGFQLMTGSGDPKQIEMGKKRITYSIVGFLIVFFAYWGVQLIAIMFGIREWKTIFGI